MKLNCIVLDDDPACRDLVAAFVNEHPHLQLITKFSSPLEAKHFLETAYIDLLFADMEMPGINGIDLIKGLTNPPHVIFITSHRDFAVEGFEVKALDYILKPIKQERFDQAVEHALQIISANKNSDVKSDEGKQDDHFFIREDSQYVKINYKDVVFVEALKDFVKIHTPAKTHIALVNLKNIEETLPAEIFLRTHRSYLVNRFHINAINAHDIETTLAKVPLGNSYKDAVWQEVLGNRLVKR